MFKALIFDQPPPQKESELVILEPTIYFTVFISKEALLHGTGLEDTTIVKKISSSDIETSIEQFIRGNLATRDGYRNFIVKLGGITKYWYNDILSVHSIEIIDYQPRIISIRQEVTKDNLKSTLDPYYKETPNDDWVLNRAEMINHETWLSHGRILHLLSLEKIVSLPQLVVNLCR